MKSSTGNIEISYDIRGAVCSECKALRADVNIRGGKVREVDLSCEVAEGIDLGVDRRGEGGISIGQICRIIRGKMKKAEHVEGHKVFCSPLRDAERFLKKHEPEKRAAKKAFDPIEVGEDWV